MDSEASSESQNSEFMRPVKVAEGTMISRTERDLTRPNDMNVNHFTRFSAFDGTVPVKRGETRMRKLQARGDPACWFHVKQVPDGKFGKPAKTKGS